jgi:hypothetical protein
MIFASLRKKLTPTANRRREPMVRLLLCVVSLGVLLLFASAAPGQVCTRYENGRTYILPGCRGPADPGDGIDVDGTIGGRRHPFTGQSFSAEMSVLSWNAMMGLVLTTSTPPVPLVSDPADAALPPFTGQHLSASAQMQSWPQSMPTVLVPLVPDPVDLPVVLPLSLSPIVEAPFTVVLTASFSQPLAYGSRVSRIRVTNRDLIEEFKEQFGVSGRRARLVIRRELWDLEGAEAQLYMILDGVDYLVEDFLEPLPLSLPEGFYGRASGHTRNRRTGAVSSFHFQEVSAMALGDLAVDGFTMGLFSLDGGRFRPLVGGRSRPLVQPWPPALLCSRFTSKVTGGMQMSELPLDSPMLVTGMLLIGSERVLSP